MVGMALLECTGLLGQYDIYSDNARLGWESWIILYLYFMIYDNFFFLLFLFFDVAPSFTKRTFH